MKRQDKARRRCAVNAGRWISYAAAGAATAVAASNDADGAIMYSGTVNLTYSVPGASRNINLKLLSGGHSTFARLHHSAADVVGFGGMSSSSAHAKFKVLGSFLGRVQGNVPAGHPYASKLALGAAIGSPFNASGASNTMAKGGAGAGQWTALGTGFLGFEFNAGAGLQFGWARVTMASNGHPGFGLGQNWDKMTLVDYAYGTPGQAITAGQTVVPEPASLGMLAVGALGVVALRGGKKKTPFSAS